MKVDVMLRAVDGDVKVGTARVSRKTDLKEKVKEVAGKYWGNEDFDVRRDVTLFIFIAVNRGGDIIYLRG